MHYLTTNLLLNEGAIISIQDHEGPTVTLPEGATYYCKIEEIVNCHLAQHHSAPFIKSHLLDGAPRVPFTLGYFMLLFVAVYRGILALYRNSLLTAP